MGDLVAGVDLATADVRVEVADGSGRVKAHAQVGLPRPVRSEPGRSEQDARAWWPAVAHCLRQATASVSPGDRIVAVAVAATSGSVLLADKAGEPVGPALLYDDQRAPATARWAWLLDQPGAAEAASYAWHASDLVVGRLLGDRPPTDWSHALKTGFDPGRGGWEADDAAADLRPRVLPPTSLAGVVSHRAAAETGLPAGCQVRLGMTDGCAAQVAAGADRPGRFVTVVGTTLVVKGATEDRIDDPGAGVYSHRHPDGWWLPGGASNTGGGSLVSRFPEADLADLDRGATARGPAQAVCYPLSGQGERFPFAAPDATEIWTARPADALETYRAVLEGVAFVERLGYERLAALGAKAIPPLGTAGGGSRSPLWSAIRSTVLGVPVVRSPSADTAFGACVLAAVGTLHRTLSAATDSMVAAAGPPVEPVDAERRQLDENYGRFVEALTDRGWLPWAA